MEVTKEMIRELVELTKELTAIPAPSHDEGRRVAFLKDYLEKNGYHQVTVDEALNVIVEVGEEGAEGGQASEEERKLHLYTAHTDTVFPDTTPIPVEEKDGCLYGPGVGDDTANAAAMAIALKYIKQAGCTPRRPIAYVFDSCEEGLGNLKGMWAAYHRYEKVLKRHIAIDGSTDHIVNRAVGSSRYEITVTTKGGHSFNNYGNRNAIAVASEMILALYQIDTSDLPGKTTYNVGIIKGGTSVNTIAQEVTFCYEYRSDEQESLDRMKECAQERLSIALGGKEVKLTDGFQVSIDDGEESQRANIKITLLGNRPGMGPVSESGQKHLTKHIADKLIKYTGHKPSYDSGSTDCNIPLSNGIEAACFGIYLGAGQHTRQEYIQIDSMKAGMQTLLELMLEDYEGDNL